MHYGRMSSVPRNNARSRSTMRLSVAVRTWHCLVPDPTFWYAEAWKDVNLMVEQFPMKTLFRLCCFSSNLKHRANKPKPTTRSSQQKQKCCFDVVSAQMIVMPAAEPGWIIALVCESSGQSAHREVHSGKVFPLRRPSRLSEPAVRRQRYPPRTPLLAGRGPPYRARAARPARPDIHLRHRPFFPPTLRLWT